MVTPFSSQFIQFRELAINLAFRIPNKELLNPQPFKGNAPSSLELVYQINQAVTRFKQQAMDETGAHVDYQSLRQTDAFTSYTRELIPQLQSLKFEDISDRNTATAFWINLYNALVIHAVIEYGIEKSITERGFSGQVRFFRQAAYNIGGMRFSLEDIEHGVLRANSGNPLQFSQQFPPDDPRTNCIISPLDPRIHFALNCASVSCPPISVYDPHNLDLQLDLASQNYVQQETRLENGEIYLSRLFQWYKKDFGSPTDIVDFLLRYLPDSKRKKHLASIRQNPSFRYLPYNWNLNI